MCPTVSPHALAAARNPRYSGGDCFNHILEGKIMKPFLKAAAVAAVTLSSAFTAALANAASDASAEARLEAVLEDQPTAIKARYTFRHPKETLMFFGVKPGMTVADTLAGEYYSRILLPYLGDEGRLIGVHYAKDHRAIDFKDKPERMAQHMGWPARFEASSADWRAGSKAAVEAHLLGDLPESLDGTVDVFLMLRAVHHLHKYEDQAATLSNAFADAMRLLKPGGTLGIVQHRAPEDASDEWAKGFNGYVKQSAVIAAAKAAGFEFVASSEVNANPGDVPTEDDYVWRLPPANKSGKNDHIGESDRMTLKFRKPA
jgi:predicted methyltransferase